MRLVTGGPGGAGADVDATERDGEGAVLDALADVNLSAATDIMALVDRVRRRADGGVIIAVLGGLSVAEAESLGALRANGATCVALLVDPSTWLSLPDEARAQAAADHEASATVLLRSGWRVVGVEHGSSIATLWPQAARGSQSFAWRAAMAETVSPTGGKVEP
jgi:hypothetical protein